MGVKGLTSFINTYHQECLKPKYLHDCFLIVDGSNVAYSLLYKPQEGYHVFGGDYDMFAREVEAFFEPLLKCNIKPIVLFDGGLNENKLETELERTGEKIRNSLNCSPNKSTRCAAPLFMLDVFFNVLKNLNIDFMRCEKEADCDVATLAKMLDAPVLSVDSDFYIYDVQFIPLDCLSLEVCTDEKLRYLECRQFDRSAFSSKYDVDPTMFPLLAAVVGNDYVNAEQSERLCLEVPSHSVHEGPLHEKIVSVLVWLRNQDDLNTASKNLRKRMPRNERVEYKQIIQLGMAEYLPSYETQKLVLTKKKREISRILKNWGWNASYYDDGEFPQFFEQAVKRGKLPRFCFNLVEHGFAIMASQVECKDSPPAYQSALGLLLSLSLILRGDLSKSPVVCFYMRYIVNLHPQTYVLRCSVPPVGTTLTQIETLSFRQKRHLLARIMDFKNVDWVDGLPQDLQLFILAVVYWSRFSQVQVKSSHSLSVILCLVFLYLLEYRKGVVKRSVAQLKKIRKRYSNQLGNLNSSELSFEELLSLLSTHECVVAKCILSKYLHLAESDSQFERKRVQGFSNFQAILQVSDCLNVLLGELYTRPVVRHLLSGTVFYSMCCALDQHENPKAYVNNILIQAPNVLALFNRIADAVETGISACGSKSKAEKEMGLQWVKDVSVVRIHGFQNQRIVQKYGFEGLDSSRLILEGLLGALVSE